MHARFSSRIAIAFSIFALGIGACGPAEETEIVDSSSQELGRVIPIDNLLEDANIEGDEHVTVEQVQAFLGRMKSALATYSVGGRTAAQWIVEESRAERISPIYMLARLETESSIVRSGTLNKASQATGCGCPDGAACDPRYAGFGNQIRCAAQLMRGYFRSLETQGATVTGWRVGVGRSTSDPCWVHPANKATAALYTYTPWVGAYGIGCGTAQWGGSSLVAALYREFRSSFPARPPAEGECSLGDGLYCGGNGTPGDALTLYRCTGGIASPVRTCALGCKHNEPGKNDECVEGSRCPYGDGAYCGGNGVGGAPNTLYHCAAGRLQPKEVCATECQHMPAGKADVCR